MQTTAHKKYRHQEKAEERRVCRNRDCSRIQDEIRTAMTGASEVHHALCAPEWQRIAQYEIASLILPVRHIGGDFVCRVEAEGATILVLGDLMGKGLSAAMWITHILDLVHRAAEDFSSLPSMMTRLNAEIVRSRVRAPLTSAIAVAFDRESEVIHCASAGHPPAIVVRSDATTELLTTGGPLLGVFADAKYEASTVRLSPSDALVAFSDGVTGAQGSSEEEFSLSRATQTLARHAALGARQKLIALLEASRSFSGKGLFDDASALVVQRA